MAEASEPTDDRSGERGSGVRGSLRELAAVDRQLPAIVVENLSETFKLYHESPIGLKERLYRFRRPTFERFEALRDVSFTVAHGESVGIIGHNGSGKSTLLKILARILPPDEGRVRINGRMASLLELGAGMHGDLSGRENIYLNGAILGLTRAEIDERFEWIVEFAGIRHFLDTAVRNYSSGMYVRLGFAIAVSVDPDVLLVDEVLSVGDAEFQQRSLDRMRSFRERGKTVVIVSHDMGAIADLVDRVIVLDAGRIVFDGSVGDGVGLYQQLMGQQAGPDGEAAVMPDVTLSSDGPRIVSSRLVTEDGQPALAVLPGSGLRLDVTVEARGAVEACSVGVSFLAGDGRLLYETNTTWHGLGLGPLAAGQRARLAIDLDANLLAGHYTVQTKLTDARMRVTHDLSEPVRLRVDPAPGRVGLVDLRARLSVLDGPALRMDAFTGDGITSEPLRVVDRSAPTPTADDAASSDDVPA